MGYHPIFSRIEKPKAYTVGHEHPRTAAIRANPACATLPTLYKMSGNKSIMFLPKAEVEARTQTLRRSTSCPGTGTSGIGRSTESSKPKAWRTRELVTSYDGWAHGA